MLIVLYSSKKELATKVGQPLNYIETSVHGEEYKPDGWFCVSNRPSITGVKGREFFAQITMEGGRIAKVS